MLNFFFFGLIIKIKGWLVCCGYKTLNEPTGVPLFGHSLMVIIIGHESGRERPKDI